MDGMEFLTGQHGAAPSNLAEAIDSLDDASLLFVSSWDRGDLKRAGDVSKGAMILLDFIVNELLREEVYRKGANIYAGTPFAMEMERPCGQGVTGAMLADQYGVMQAGPGDGRPVLFGHEVRCGDGLE